MSNISDLVGNAAKAAQANNGKAPKAADNRKKFIVFMETGDKNLLDNVSKVAGVGKIELGSSIFSIALKEAAKKLQEMGLLDAQGNIVEKPAAPAAPAASAATATAQAK